MYKCQHPAACTPQQDPASCLAITTHPVQVGVCAVAVLVIRLRHVVVDDDVHALNVNAAPHQVSGHQNALAALLEQLVGLQALLL